MEAVRHAQAAREWALASRLLADNHLDLSLDGRLQTVSELLSAFPRDVAVADPELALVFATACLLQGELDESAAYIDFAERTTDVVAQERKAGFELYLAVLRLVLARWRGELETVLEAKRRVEAGLAAQPAGGQRPPCRVQVYCVDEPRRGRAVVLAGR